MYCFVFFHKKLWDEKKYLIKLQYFQLIQFVYSSLTPLLSIVFSKREYPNIARLSPVIEISTEIKIDTRDELRSISLAPRVQSRSPNATKIQL